MQQKRALHPRTLLDRCVLFKGLSAGERGAIAAQAHIKTYRAGETIFRSGSPGDQMMAVLHGTIRITLPGAKGKELCLAIVHPGEFFGELAVLDGKERSADAIAAQKCTLAILERKDILSFFKRNPSAWPKLVKVLTQRLRQTDQAFAEVALLQLPVRLAKAVLRISDRKTSSSEDVKIRFSQRGLANMVGGTRESVNKCMRNWQRDGMISVSGGLIIIPDRRAFERIAEVT